jgi:predicted RNA-binding Zn-ribbon protein involved in translation (DUF1610 family)
MSDSEAKASDPATAPASGPATDAASADRAEARMFPCEGCGAELEFAIGAQQLVCPYCGYTKHLTIAPGAQVVEQDYAAALNKEAARRAPAKDSAPLFEVRCNSCGGQVFFAGTLTSTTCPYCASPIQREGVHEAQHQDRLPVDAVLPFQVDAKKAADNLASWVRSRWFLPRALRQLGIQGHCQGVYTPYFTYDTMTANAYQGQRGEYYSVTVGTGKNTRQERRTRWYPASGAFQRFFDDVLVVAAHGLPADLLRALEPWPLERVIPFTAEVLAGFLARTYDIELDAGFATAKTRIDETIREDVCDRIGGDTQRVDSIRTSYAAITFKHLLLPVWLLAYKHNKKSYQVAINAASGEVVGERPYDWVKILLLVLVLAIVVGTIILLSR